MSTTILAMSAPAYLSSPKLEYVRDLLRKSRIAFAWDWSARAWGYCREFESLGMTALVLGPMHVQFDWDI